MYDCDVLIIGGGLAGASLARALRDLPLRLALVEAQGWDQAAPRRDPRAIALSYGSARIFQGLGLWQGLPATPIRRIHVSDRGHFGFTRLDCEQLGIAALGYVLEASDMEQALRRELKQQANLALHCGSRLEQLDIGAEQATARIVDAQGQIFSLTTRLLVAADGAASAARRLLDMPARIQPYHQTAIVCQITPAQPQACTAYERFTETGPLALLPMQQDRYALVWTVAGGADELLAMDEGEFLRRLQLRFGWRLGRMLQATPRHAFPLMLSYRHEAPQPRLALLGNAAHTLHPVAGQGLNLGLRDVATLAELLRDHAGGDPGALPLLQHYAQQRRADQGGTVYLTDGLLKLFANDSGVLAAARNAGMAALDRCGPLKNQLLRYAAGIGGKSTRLERGLPLLDT